MDLDIGDLRALPQKQLSKWTSARQPLQGSYQFNGLKLIVSCDGERLWAVDPNNTDKYSEILQGLTFQALFQANPNQGPLAEPSGFALYRISTQIKITFCCLQQSRLLLPQWLTLFRSLAIPEIGFHQSYHFPQDSPENAPSHKVFRRSDNKQFYAKIIPTKNYKENTKLSNKVRTMIKCQHENVLQIQGYYLTKNYSIVLTEWVPDTLADYLPSNDPSRTLSEPQFKKILYGIMQAIRQMNLLGLGHFAITKEHILIKQDKTSLLTGFSEAKQADYTADLINRPGPKRTKKNIDADYQSIDPRLFQPLEIDSFFLGAIIYQYFSGTPPFKNAACIAYEESKSQQVILWDVAQQNPKCSKNALNLMKRMLHRDRIKRAHMGNLKAHKYFEQFFPAGLKKQRRKRKDQPPPAPNPTKIRQSDDLSDSDSGGKKSKMGGNNAVQKHKPIQKRPKAIIKKESLEIIEHSASKNAQMDNNANFEANAFFSPEFTNGGGSGELRNTERDSLAMQSDYQDNLSFFDSIDDVDGRLLEVEDMEDEGASIWGNEEMDPQ